MRKLISFISAAALASTMLVPIAAQAEGETVLWSDTFDNYTNAVETKAVGNVLVDGTSVAKNAYELIPGLKLYTTNRTDDSSYYKVTAVNTEDSTDLYLQTQTSRFSRQSAGAYMQFDKTYTAEEGKDVVLAFDLYETNAKETTYDNVFQIGSTQVTVPATDKEIKVKAVVNTSGTSVYLDDSTTAVATSTDTSISTISFNSYVGGAVAQSDQKATSLPLGYPTYYFNDMVVYTSADGANSTVPAATAQTPLTPVVATPTPAPAEITATTTYDFESDDKTISISDASSVTAAVETGTDEANTTKVLAVTGSSEKTSQFGKAALDFSALTEGKSHVIVDYDVYMSNAGRMMLSLTNAAPTGYSDYGMFSQGIKGISSYVNIAVGEWVHTSVDVNLATGTGTYTVTKADDTTVASGNITTTAQELKYLYFITWSANTTYIDNLTVKTGGTLTVTTPTPAPTASPEPKGEAEGSDVDLATVGKSAEKLGTFEAAQTGDATKVENHSKAYKAQTTESNTAISAYSASARGYSIYAAYDVYVTAGSSISVTPYGDKGNAQASSLTLTGKEDGTIGITIPKNSDTTNTIKNDLVCGTWYRVVMEIPQNGDSTTTTTSGLKYNVYRIDSADATKSTLAVSADAYPRGLDKKGVTSIGVSVTGDVYIDNGVVYRAAQASTATPAPTASPEPAGTAEGSNVDLAAAGGSVEQLDTLAKAQTGDAAKIENHSSAYKAQSTESNTAISAYSEKARGFSIYVAYDVYVTAGSSISVTPYGNGGASEASSLTLTGKEDGTVGITIPKDSSTTDTVKNDLVCGTWYRVVMEIPQKGDTTSTKTTDLKYNVYRIDSADPTKSTLAVSAGAYARGLAARGVSSIGVSVTGDVYIDNGAVYRAATYVEPTVWTQYTVTYSKDGLPTAITMATVEDPSTVTIDTAGTAGDNGTVTKTFVWDQHMTPYTVATTD